MSWVVSEAERKRTTTQDNFAARFSTSDRRNNRLDSEDGETHKATIG